MRINAVFLHAGIPAVLLGAAAVCLGLDLSSVAERVLFPWDALGWSESPFMTNMMKLSRGVPIYSDPADANSFVYSPGLEYVCWALLRPFNLQLEAAWCRAISVAPLLVAAAASGLWMRSVLSGEDRKVSPFFMPSFFCVVLLMTLRSFTATVIHPDNLYLCHSVLTGILCWLAIIRGSAAWGIGAIFFASIGAWTKQPALLSACGVVLALLVGRKWDRRSAVVFVVAGAAALTISAGMLWGHAFRRFYTLELLMEHGMDAAKLIEIVLGEIGARPHRLLLFLVVPLGVMEIAFRRTQKTRAWLAVWASLGFFEILPTLSAYLKAMGFANNLNILDFWLMLGASPLLQISPSSTAGGEFKLKGANSIDEALLLSAGSAARAWGFLLVLLCLFPLQFFQGRLAPLAAKPRINPMLDAHYKYCENLEEYIWRDLRAGKRVLLGHGTSVLVRNGIREPPFDRMNSVLELETARKANLAETGKRISEGKYDRIYLPETYLIGAYWYGPEIVQKLQKRYRIVETLPDAFAFAPPNFDKLAFPGGVLMGQMQIYEKGEAAKPNQPKAPPPKPAR